MYKVYSTARAALVPAAVITATTTSSTLHQALLRLPVSPSPRLPVASSPRLLISLSSALSPARFSRCTTILVLATQARSMARSHATCPPGPVPARPRVTSRRPRACACACSIGEAQGDTQATPSLNMHLISPLTCDWDSGPRTSHPCPCPCPCSQDSSLHTHTPTPRTGWRDLADGTGKCTNDRDIGTRRRQTLAKSTRERSGDETPFPGRDETHATPRSPLRGTGSGRGGSVYNLYLV
jgi:hypothetical protein